MRFWQRVFYHPKISVYLSIKNTSIMLIHDFLLAVYYNLLTKIWLERTHREFNDEFFYIIYNFI